MVGLISSPVGRDPHLRGRCRVAGEGNSLHSRRPGLGLRVACRQSGHGDECRQECVPRSVATWLHGGQTTARSSQVKRIIAIHQWEPLAYGPRPTITARA